MMNTTDFVRLLENEADRYINVLEGLFGPRDRRFTFGGVEKSTDPKDSPQIHYPNGYRENGCLVKAQISSKPWVNQWLNQGLWQLSHECVHLLDPGEFETANRLEEGLATWFQNQKEHHQRDEVCTDYIRKSRKRAKANYAIVEQLVAQCMPYLPHAIEEIRAGGVRIRDITTDVLASHLPLYTNKSVVGKLCEKFDY